MYKNARNYIIRLLVQRALGLLLYLLGAWWTMHLRSLVYFAIYFAAAIISSAVMYRVNPETLAERGKTGTNSPKWDKSLLGIYWLLAFFMIYYTAGLEAAKAPAPGAIFLIGIVLQFPAVALSLRAMMVNAFLVSTARIQTEREQVVCKAGPYRIIRHPTYTSVLLWCLSVPMVFGTLMVSVISAVIAVIITIRTYLEDKMLKEHLDGYEEYTREVRYRLVPFIW